MIIALAVAFRLFVSPRLVAEARRQADRGLAGSMEGHAAMDMSIASSGPLRRRLLSREGYTAVSQILVMEWPAVIRDVKGGLLIAGAVGAWVPDSFWPHLFLAGHPLAAQVWGPVDRPGPLAAQLRLLDRTRVMLVPYTTILNIIFLLVAALLARFPASGGLAMLRMMGGRPDDAGHPAHDQHAHGVTDL